MTPQCRYCGRFIPKTDRAAVRWTPWGSLHEGPPEPTIICGKCYAGETDAHKQWIANPKNAWQPVEPLFSANAEISHARERRNQTTEKL